MSTLFQEILLKGRKEGITPRSRNARSWFRDAAQKVANVNTNRLMNDKQHSKNRVDINDIGRMCMFFYDPKLKKTLPYYDKFPLIFIIGFKEDGFLGLNLHYLPPALRAKLMDALYKTINNTKLDNSTKLKITYQVLVNTSKFRYFRPCVKRYLWGHTRSNFLIVPASSWDTALFLPTARFEKADAEKVWRDSESKL